MNFINFWLSEKVFISSLILKIIYYRILEFFSFNTQHFIFYSLLGNMVPDEKTTNHNNSYFCWPIGTFSPISFIPDSFKIFSLSLFFCSWNVIHPDVFFRVFFLILLGFWYIYLFYGIYAAWYSLSYLDLWFDMCHQFWNIPSNYSDISSAVFSLFSTSGIAVMRMLHLLKLSYSS